MSAPCIPITFAPVDVTATAQGAGLRPGFRVVMTADAYARAHAEHPDAEEEGVRAVVAALEVALAALIAHEATLSVGTTWTIRTGYLTPDRWTVLVAADETDSAAVVLYITPSV